MVVQADSTVIGEEARPRVVFHLEQKVVAPFHLDATSLGKALTSAARTPREEKSLTLWHHSATSARPPQVLLQAIFGPALPHVDRSHQAVLPVVAAEDWAEPCVVPGRRAT